MLFADAKKCAHSKRFVEVLHNTSPSKKEGHFKLQGKQLQKIVRNKDNVFHICNNEFWQLYGIATIMVKMREPQL